MVPILFTVARDSGLFPWFWSEAVEACARALGFRVDIAPRKLQSAADWNAAITGYEAVITSWGTPCFAEALLGPHPALKILAYAGGSVADVVSPYLYDHNIKVTTANDIMAISVAEWVVAMLGNGLAMYTYTGTFGGTKPMLWDLNTARGKGLYGSTIGIWGYGAIARRVVERLRGFAPAKIMVNSAHLSPEQAGREGLQLGTLEQVFEQCDAVVLLAAMTEKNANRIAADLLTRLRDGALLVNAGRARLVAEEDLMRELRTGRFNFCADVFHRQPLPADDPLQRLPNVILTPHRASVPTEQLYVPAMLEELHRFFNGQPLLHEVPRERAVTMTSHAAAFKPPEASGSPATAPVLRGCRSSKYGCPTRIRT